MEDIEPFDLEKELQSSGYLLSPATQLAHSTGPVPSSQATTPSPRSFISTRDNPLLSKEMEHWFESTSPTHELEAFDSERAKYLSFPVEEVVRKDAFSTHGWESDSDNEVVQWYDKAGDLFWCGEILSWEVATYSERKMARSPSSLTYSSRRTNIEVEEDDILELDFESLLDLHSALFLDDSDAPIENDTKYCR
ncbi:hypothetical protein NM688_g8152 [Phlebia brevispora]|uniref:Uncharacterized protein n=1 Tax=Phlebia brevispora TaxID=194682 RepID=A0ACC1RX34_9APHY|nr:hypothetical protein NM688_g8152 [Phlebia brevispora]